MISADPTLLARITALRGLIGSCGFFPELTAVESQMDALLQGVEVGLSASARPFRIVLAGGTGVGKSTLLNALARSYIAPVGETRPTTRGFTAYLHETEHDSWVEGLLNTKIVRHHRDRLRGKTIIDSPDADSSLMENRRMVHEMIAAADLVLLVATQEKYVSESLLRLVRRYRRGRAFAFVFNKTDLCTSTDVVDDYKRVLESLRFPVSRIYTLSAKQAGEQASHEYPTTTDEFCSLEEFIASELDRTRIREIEAENLAQRVTEVLRLVQSVLPERWESAAERWQDHCHEVLSQLFAEIGTMVSRRALDREDLADAITFSRGSALAGPFGFVAEVIYALQRFRTRGSSLLRFDATEMWVRANVGVSLSETIDRRAAYAQEACCYDGMQFGLDPQSLRDAMRDSMGDQVMSPGWFEEQLASHLHVELKHQSHPPGLWMNMLVNLVPWAWILYWIYRLVDSVLSGEPAPWEAIPGAAVVLLALVLLQWSLVHKLLRWNAKKRAEALVSRVLSAVEVAFLARRLPAIARVADGVQASTHEIKRSLLAMQAVIRNGHNESAPQRLVTGSPSAVDQPHSDSVDSGNGDHPS